MGAFRDQTGTGPDNDKMRGTGPDNDKMRGTGPDNDKMRGTGPDNDKMRSDLKNSFLHVSYLLFMFGQLPH